jgi:mono/diheme cytochrome c family protein
MTRPSKLALSLIGLVLLLALVAVQAVVGWRAVLFGPRARALTARRFETTPERLARGRYLVEARHGCLICHSERDWSLPGAPPRPDRLGAGVVWSAEGMPWLVAANLTPDPDTGLGRASDDAIVRAVREGIGADGRALFALMPYGEYRRIPDDDMAAIVVYLRALSPVRNPLPRTRLPFPLNVIMKGVPEPIAGAVPPPDLSTPEKRGEYVLRTSACHHCHTPMRRGQLVAALDMAGGGGFSFPGGTAYATNVTLDATGIGNYDAATFTQVIRTGKLGTLSPFMPWVAYREATDEDLAAVFAYLRSLPLVKHVVVNGLPATPCRVCGLEHGGGDSNGS